MHNAEEVLYSKLIAEALGASDLSVEQDPDYGQHLVVIRVAGPHPTSIYCNPSDARLLALRLVEIASIIDHRNGD